jgi:membrane associated rhomboid family serine protease
VVVALIGLCGAIHALQVYLFSLDPEWWAVFLARTAFIPLLYSGQFEIDVFAISAPVTYSLLHANLTHLAINMVWLLAFGSPLANRMGTWRFLLFWVVTAIAAAALHYAFHRYDATPLVGASGAIAGMMGAAARFGFRIDRSAEKPAFSGRPLPIMFVLRLRPVVTFLAIWMVINLFSGLFGLVPGEEGTIAWEAHVGGFLAGFFGIGAFIPAERQGQQGQESDAG